MVKMKISYLGDFETECVHESGCAIKTEPPKDLGGEAKCFSPTDLVGAALGSCILTVMGMAAKKLGFDFKGASAEVEKEMSASPRRIGKLVVRIRCSNTPSSQVQQKLEQAALNCPVHASLHPDISQEIDFVWGI